MKAHFTEWSSDEAISAPEVHHLKQAFKRLMGLKGISLSLSQ